MAEALVTVNSIVLSAISGQDLPMRQIICAIFLLCALAACGPVSVYYHPDVTATRMQSDLLDCQVAALRDAPVASQLRRGPPRYIPGYRHCDSKKHCYHRRGYLIPGEIYSVDVNARLRGDLETRCMARSGYQSIELPRCSRGSLAADTTARTDQMPVLTENACVLRDNSGRWEIIEPAG